MAGGCRVTSEADVVWAVEFEVGTTAAGVAGQDSGAGTTMGERDREMGVGTGVGEGEFLLPVFLPSIWAPVIRAAREERSQKVGFQTSKGGELESWFVDEGDSLPWVVLNPWLSPVADRVESWLELLLLR